VTVDDDPALQTVEDSLAMTTPIRAQIETFLRRCAKSDKPSFFKAVIEGLEDGSLPGDLLVGAGIAFIQEQVAHDVNDLSDTVKGLLSALNHGEHDCTTCAKYDACDLSIRKPRP
jgi:hypothetical protein